MLKYESMNAPETTLNGLALMSQIFRGPTPELCREMKSDAFQKELTELAAVLGEPGKKHLKAIKTILDAQPDPSRLHQDLEAQYVRLFISAPGGVKAPLYQSHFTTDSGRLMGSSAKKMQKRRQAAGLDPQAPTDEPPDHLSSEIDYLFLNLESAFMEGAPEVLKAAQRFADEELLPFAKAITERLENETENPFYPAAVNILINLLQFIKSI